MTGCVQLCICVHLTWHRWHKQTSSSSEGLDFNGRFTFVRNNKFKATESHHAFKIRGTSDITRVLNEGQSLSLNVKSHILYTVNNNLQNVSGVVINGLNLLSSTSQRPTIGINYFIVKI